jgi:hypothetical protein
MSDVLAAGTQVEWASRTFDPLTGGSRPIVQRGEVVGADAADGSVIVETGPVRYHVLPAAQVRPSVPVADVPTVVVD